MPPPTPDRPQRLQELLAAYRAQPEHEAVLQALNLQAWEAFHDPWATPPVPPQPARLTQGRLSIEGEAPAAAPGPLTLATVRLALEMLGLAPEAIGKGLRFSPLGNGATGLPWIRAGLLPGPPAGQLALAARWRLPVGQWSPERALRFCNGFNHGHRLLRALLEPANGMSEGLWLGLALEARVGTLPGCTPQSLVAPLTEAVGAVVTFDRLLQAEGGEEGPAR
jgi:hypothetical protein